MLSVAMTRSSFDVVAICYVLPVLWMASRFTLWALRCVLNGENVTAETTASIPISKLRYTIEISKYTWWLV